MVQLQAHINHKEQWEKKLDVARGKGFPQGPSDGGAADGSGGGTSGRRSSLLSATNPNLPDMPLFAEAEKVMSDIRAANSTIEGDWGDLIDLAQGTVLGANEETEQAVYKQVC